MNPALVVLIFIAKYGTAAIVGEAARDLYRSAKKGDLSQQVKNQVDLTKEYWHNLIKSNSKKSVKQDERAFENVSRNKNYSFSDYKRLNCALFYIR